MPSSTATLSLSVDPATALETARRALSDEVWEVEDRGGAALIAWEWPWRINCQTSPARIEIRTDVAADGATELRLEGSVPGFGPIPRRHLARHLEGLEGRIRQGCPAVRG